MSKFKNYLFATAGLALFVSILALTLPRPSRAQNDQAAGEVRIINTAAEAVPVSGNLSLTNTPTVKAQQSGAWNVCLTGSSKVGLAAGSSIGIDPVDVINIYID